MYSAIEIANLTIAGLEEYGNMNKDADMAYLMAKAKTLRAMPLRPHKGLGDVPEVQAHQFRLPY